MEFFHFFTTYYFKISPSVGSSGSSGRVRGWGPRNMKSKRPPLATIFLPPANEVWGKVIFLQVCVILSTGGHACLWGGMCGCLEGACGCRGAWLLGGVHGCWGACGCGGHAWLPGSMHGCWGSMCGCRGACMVVGGCAWLWGAFMAAGGACVVAGGCVGYDEIRRYASYWNAFCFDLFSQGRGACPPPPDPLLVRGKSLCKNKILLAGTL